MISYRKGCSLRHIYESKIIKKASKLDIPRSRIKHVNNMENLLEILRSHLGLSAPTYTGALINPVSKATKYFLMSRWCRVTRNFSYIMIPPISVLSPILPLKRGISRSRLPIFIPHLSFKIYRIPHPASILSLIPHHAKPIWDPLNVILLKCEI